MTPLPAKTSSTANTSSTHRAKTWLPASARPQEITVEGSRRWAELQGICEEANAREKYPSLEEVMPAAFTELNEIQQHLEDYFKDMQDHGIHDPERQTVDAADA